ncbi:hypothetical protein [Bartonella sp. CB74]|uniref:hypothetical protein n=1 Tax=Bartonella sp. CB74 TaxID=3113620 RepID=UPI002F963CD7
MKAKINKIGGIAIFHHSATLDKTQIFYALLQLDDNYDSFDDTTPIVPVFYTREILNANIKIFAIFEAL